MKRSILIVAAIVLGYTFAIVSVAEARTMVRVGMFGTKVRAGCGASVYVGPCGQVQVGYGGGCSPCGAYAAPHCGGGGCGVQQQCGGGCATATCAYASGAPFGVNCTPNYGTHTQTCTESFVPYGGAGTFAMPAADAYGAQLRYRGY